ncbi:hypothetical protein [Tessaracoccus massiliensis]|uniref:hypothetical protein n=1 Tax=Tessaracoccus massiliensis TaxID=1522311 RepID=UPI00059064C9|nr:hypothetical protein [Tessaracoccus massiliensis]
MIATLFKHESRRTLRWFALIVLAGVVVAGSSALLAAVLPAPLNGLFAVLGAIGAGAVPGIVPIWLGIEFYRSSYSRTGYLTRALPVKGTTIFWVKLAYAYVLSLLSVVVGLALMYVAAIGFTVAGGGTVGDLNRSLADTWAIIVETPGWVVAMVVALLFLLPLQWLASYFFAATRGSEAWSNKLGLGGPILVWFLFYFASQAAGLLGALIPLQVAFVDGALRLQAQWLNIFTMDDQNIVPVGVFLGIALVSLVAIVWAAVSFDRKAELR